MTEKKRIVILSFSFIHQDARVLRQIEFLSRHFTVDVVGYGHLGQDLPRPVRMLPIPASKGYKVLAQLLHTELFFVLGKLHRGWPYEAWYWGRDEHRRAFDLLVDCKPDAIHANDWVTLPLATRAAQITGAKVVLDLHEYAPLERGDVWHWRTFHNPAIDYSLRTYSSYVSRSITVNQAIADRYGEEYGFVPEVVMNIPTDADEVNFVPTRPDRIRLVHHGSASESRKLELMIRTMAYTDHRYSLHLMLIPSSSPYVVKLRKLAQELAPDRVFFHEPVPPKKIVGVLSEYDMGFYLLPAANFNNNVALPNKFFDFVAAGLAVCTGPSIEMARLTRQYGFGVVTPSFDPREAAKVLNGLSPREIDEMKRKALEAKKTLNADREMDKLVTVYKNLFGQL